MFATIERAGAVTIDPTFDSSILNAPNATQIENSIDAAANAMDGLFSNQGTVNILFKYTPGSFLGQSNSGYYSDTYVEYVNALEQDQSANPQNSVLATAIANLSQGNDANGAESITATSALFRIALSDPTATPCFNANGNYVNECGQTFDGVITISSTQPIDFTRPVPAYNGANQTYDAIRVEEHEIDEILGGGGSGSTLGSSEQGMSFGPLDLFRYSALGVPSFSSSRNATSYFSIDGGNTEIVGFNQDPTGDFSDFLSGPCPGHVQDAFACSNAQADVTTSSPEFTMLEALGFDAIPAPNVAWNCATNPDATSYSGSVSATKTTSCTQIVTGNSTFTGGTTIAAGTLQLGNGGTTGAITGGVVNNGTLAFDRSDVVTFAGTISGSGAVQQIGTGTTILTANNTYTGGTTISAGTLQLGNGGATGLVVGNIADNGALVFDSSSNFVIGGTISGTGTLTQIGSAWIILTGNDTYTGGTTVSNGALVLGLNGTTGSITGNVTDNSSFYTLRTDQYTFGGTISGTGRFVQAGSGTTVLTANNSYTGGTIVEGGTLQLGNGGTTGSIVGNVGSNGTQSGTLAFDRSDVVTFAGTISGSGAVQQIGTGTTILAANNTYTGGTTISAGTLQLGTGGTTGLIVGNIADNGALVLDSSSNFVLGGAISGTGSLAQTGGGWMVLTGNDTYSGGTTVSNGALVLGLNGTTGSITGNVTDNSSFYSLRTDQYTFGGTISGTGRFVQAGSGTTILTANNTYTGGTIIEGGTLQLGNGGTAGSIIGNVSTSNGTQNGTLAFDRSDVVTFAGTISGSGAVQQIGTGTTILTANNTYTGGTMISAGTLEVGNSNAIGTGNLALNGAPATLVLDNGVNLSNTVDIDQAGFIDVNNTDAATISGALIGSASFEKDGTGTLTLNHNNCATYSGNIAYHGTLVAGTTCAFGTGTVTVLGSTLVLDNGVISGTHITLADNLTVVQNDGIAMLAGAVDQSGGPWGLTKLGAGTLVVAGQNTYSGTTSVAAGTLALLGTVGGDVTVASGAALTVSGNIRGNLSIQPNGTLSSFALGNGYGTLTAAAFTETNSTLGIRFGGISTGFSSNLVSVQGNAYLQAGLLSARPETPASDFTFDQTYLVIATGGTVTGQFSNPGAFVTNPFDPALLERLRYEPGGVVLEVRKLIDFTTLGTALTRNEQSVARAINSTELGAGDGLANSINALAAFPSTSSQNPLSQIDGEGLVNAQRIFDDSLDLFSGSIRSRLLDFGIQPVMDEGIASLNSESQIWISGLGSGERERTTSERPGYQTQLAGFSVGADTSPAKHLLVGVAAGTIFPSETTPAIATSVSGRSSYLGGYGRYDFGDEFAEAIVSLGAGRMNEKRSIALGAVTESTAADFDQQGVSTSVRYGWRLPLFGGEFEPVVGASFKSATQDGISEHDSGAGLALATTPFSTQQWTGTFAARWKILLRDGSFWFTPQASGAISMGTENTPSTTAKLAGAPPNTGSFLVTAQPLAPLSGDVGAGIDVGEDDEPITLHLLYEGSFANRLVQHYGVLRVSYGW